MKITEVRAHVLEAPLSEPFHWSFDATSVRGSCVVEIVTDAGITGWGESIGPSRLNAAVVGAFRRHLIGADPLRIDAIWHDLYNRFRDQGQKGLVVTALSAIDIALWDIKGKHFNAPVHVLMGGPVRTSVMAYATGTYRKQTGNPVDYILEEVGGYVQQGFKAVKLKIGFNVEQDAILTKAVRAKIGPDVALMVDANHGYDALEAIRYGNLVADQDIGWFEEPVIPEDRASYREVKAKQPIPVAGGECEFTRFGFLDILQSRAMDIIQPDTCAAGGLSECKKIADMALAFGVRYVPHVWGTGIGLAAALQLHAILPHAPPRHTPREPMLEFDRSEHPFRQSILTSPLEHRDGIVAIPTGPGLGIDINRDTLAKFTVEPSAR